MENLVKFGEVLFLLIVFIIEFGNQIIRFFEVIFRNFQLNAAACCVEQIVGIS